jgi:hypothetical protein
MEHFKHAFDSFIQNELVSMSVDSAILEWEKGIKRFKNYIDTATSDKSSKQKQIAELQLAKAKVNEFLESRSTDSLKQEVEQEVNELIYYLKQRVFFRVSDFYKEAFHSGLFMNELNHSKALQKGLKEFIASSGFDLSQELRATSLRIRQFIGRQLDAEWTEFESVIHGWDSRIMLSSAEYTDEDTIEFDQAFKEIDLERFKGAFSTFKNPKHFLEKGGKKQVMEELVKELHEPADEYLRSEKRKLKAWSEQMIKARFTVLIEEAKAQAFEQIDSIIQALSTVHDIEKLRSELKWLEESS